MIVRLGLIGICVAAFVSAATGAIVCPTDGSQAQRDFCAYANDAYNTEATRLTYGAVTASWKYATDITKDNEAADIKASEALAAFSKSVKTKLETDYPLAQITDPTLHRLHVKLTQTGDANLPTEDFTELENLLKRMTNIYATTKICKDAAITDITKCPENQKLALDPDLNRIMASSSDLNELQHVWKAWRDNTGRLMKKDYERYVELKNKGAQGDTSPRGEKFLNNGQAWRSPYVEPIVLSDPGYTDTEFLDDIKKIYNEQLKPLYAELHAYIRFQLKKKYPTANIAADGPIPAHLLGNMWAQTWNNLLSFTQPFPNQPTLDVTDEMKKKNYSPFKMFQISNQFFTDLGLIPMPGPFWAESMIEKPGGRDVVCHASAWDFYNQQDFRVKQCTEVTMDQLLTVHHEMGHVEYYLQYKDLPIPFRRGANDGFHEAIGDTLALSVATPAHLKKIGLVTGDVGGKEMDTNFLYTTALDKIAFLPFGLMMDLYRYDIFEGKIKPAEYNTKWWEFSLEYQGICSPVERGADDFDAGAKNHVPTDVPYIRYYVSFIIQFQFHRALCEAADQPLTNLHNCDIDGSKAAGLKLEAALKAGSSKSWQDVMEALTGSRKIDAGALLEYFKDIETWLKAENEKNGVKPGWDPKGSTTCLQTPVNPPTTTPGTTDSSASTILSSVITLAVAVLGGMFI